MDPRLSPRELPSRVPHRLPSWADARALGVLVVIAMVLALFWWWSGRPQEGVAVVSPNSRPPAGESVATSAASPMPESGARITVPGESSGADPSRDQAPTSEPLVPEAESQVVVDVRGAVRKRGIQILPTGSRVVDAIEAAGGLRPGRSYGGVNLAELLSDGQQLFIGRKSAASRAPNAPASRPPGSGTRLTPDSNVRLDLNVATSEQLESLPGVGPVLAERIVAWREQHGRFSSVEDLLDVSGIGDKVLAGLRDGVSV